MRHSPRVYLASDTFPHRMTIPLIDDAFFQEHESLFDIIEVSGMGIALMIQLCTGILALSKLCCNESEIAGKLVILFSLSFAFAVLCTSSLITVTAIQNTYHPDYLHVLQPAFIITYSFIIYFYGSFLFILLVNLVTRLYVTFQDGALRMSHRTMYSFGSILLILFMFGVALVLGTTLQNCGHQAIGSTIFLTASCCASLFYVVGCALAVHQFAINLSKIAKKQAGSHRELCLNPENFSLNNKQLTLLHLSAKYILLFFVAISSTILNVLFFFIVSSQCGGVFGSIDLCVNLLCLYLQFAFAKDHYRTLCGCFDIRFRNVVLNRTRREMHAEYLNMKKRRITEISIVSGSGSQSNVIKDEDGTT